MSPGTSHAGVRSGRRRGRLGSAALWWQGARPRTLAIGAVPVAVGAAAAGHATVARTIAALVVSLGLQVGANYANDYFDGVRGVDGPGRRGPLRLVASGSAPPGAVLAAAVTSLAIAVVAGTWLTIAAGQFKLVAVGAAAVAAALLYTGGPHPYAASGLADVAVFGFFGPVATAGTALLEAGGVAAAAWWASVPVGLLAVAVLTANNLRDFDTDAGAGRRTLMVRLGERRGRWFYQATVITALTVPLVAAALGELPRAALALVVTLPLAIPPLRTVRRGTGPALVPALLATARLHLAVGLVLTVALVAGS